MTQDHFKTPPGPKKGQEMTKIPQKNKTYSRVGQGLVNQRLQTGLLRHCTIAATSLSNQLQQHAISTCCSHIHVMPHKSASRPCQPEPLSGNLEIWGPGNSEFWGTTNPQNSNYQNQNPCRPKCRQGLDQQEKNILAPFHAISVNFLHGPET